MVVKLSPRIKLWSQKRIIYLQAEPCAISYVVESINSSAKHIQLVLIKKSSINYDTHCEYFVHRLNTK